MARAHSGRFFTMSLDNHFVRFYIDRMGREWDFTIEIRSTDPDSQLLQRQELSAQDSLELRDWLVSQFQGAFVWKDQIILPDNLVKTFLSIPDDELPEFRKAVERSV